MFIPSSCPEGDSRQSSTPSAERDSTLFIPLCLFMSLHTSLFILVCYSFDKTVFFRLCILDLTPDRAVKRKHGAGEELSLHLHYSYVLPRFQCRGGVPYPDERKRGEYSFRETRFLVFFIILRKVCFPFLPGSD